ncbi:alanine aminotransferase 2-like [Folsomia candida]|uniref:alanine aminotransferase 2-like n=1 Tax=Folsomia candida TaxID=158441 RepID=UPI001605490A|nr:alanine aminotransferase 2-like [Folsomia candida]
MPGSGQFLCYFLLTWIIQDSSIGISTIRAENATVSKKLTNWDRNSLTIGLVKSNYRKMEYPFHSQAYYRRLEIIEELKNGVPKPFNHTVDAALTILGPPIPPNTFLRQVTSSVAYPPLMEHFPRDVTDRARIILNQSGISYILLFKIVYIFTNY